MKPRILIEVSGGVITSVISTQEIEIVYVDYDNIRAGDLRTIQSIYEQDSIQTTKFIENLVKTVIKSYTK